MADIWVPIRAGTDIAFLGGLVRHVIEHEKLSSANTSSTTPTPRAFCGTDSATRRSRQSIFLRLGRGEARLRPESWLYEGEDLSHPKRDESLQHPRCVFQMLSRHFARYTPEMVEKMRHPTGPFQKVADALTRLPAPEKTAAICYAVGWTQHSMGVQIIRTAAILQLLLGNIGRPGGGILALRGHASIQGSTDIPTLYDAARLPAHAAWPVGARKRSSSISLETHQPHRPLAQVSEYFISLMKGLLRAPRHVGKRVRLRMAAEAYRRPFLLLDSFTKWRTAKWKGCFSWDKTPPSARRTRASSARRWPKLKWLVVRDLVEIESASFWHDSPEIERGELKTEEIGTEVFFFPAAGSCRKGGRVHQHPASPAVARKSSRATGRLPKRNLVHASTGTCA